MSKYILPEGTEVKKESVELWKGKHYYYHEKDLAEYEFAIGRECEICGNDTGHKGHMFCDSCREAKEAENYNKKPFKEWDGETPLVVYKTDIYFYDEDDIFYFCDEHNCLPEDLLLVICKREEIPEFSIADHLDDVWDWEYDIPNEDVIDKEVNTIIKKYLIENWSVWVEGKYRTRVT